ncbi:MAG: pirin family protein [Pedobacter sp.]|nr:MAG: pirin family protein [Pedobacter sp.]
MSNIQHIIPERPTHIGDFLVGRLLPFREKRMVGPFAFIDHMGPAHLAENESIDIPAHPHIGLSTLTFLFEGSMMHRDGLGTAIEIFPGQVNWMTAGKGLAHSERSPERLKGKAKSLHGLQIWVALPKHLETCAPSFYHADAKDLPFFTRDSVQFQVIAGEAFGYKSPIPVHSPLYFVEIMAAQDTQLNLGQELYGESGIYILEGEIEVEGNRFGPKQLLVAHDTQLCSFKICAGTKIYIFGGEPFPEERFIYWNFVASDIALIEAAKIKWKNQAFDPIPGETEFVPLPETKTK